MFSVYQNDRRVDLVVDLGIPFLSRFGRLDEGFTRRSVLVGGEGVSRIQPRLAKKVTTMADNVSLPKPVPSLHFT